MKWNVPTLGKMLRRIAIDAARFGYVHYLVTEVPEGKDPEIVEAKVLQYYSISASRATRYRQRARGIASVVLVRRDRKLVFLATDGGGRFHEENSPSDMRRIPLQLDGYSIGFRGDRVSVEITRRRIEAIRKKGLRMALGDAEALTRHLKEMSPFRFAGVNGQRWKLHNQINKKRKTAGLPQLKWENVQIPPRTITTMLPNSAGSGSA